MKKFVVCLILFLVLGLFAYFGFKYFVEARIISVETIDVKYCKDSDENDIYSKGTVEFSRLDAKDGEGSSTIEDSCDYFSDKAKQGIGLLREGVCDNLKLKIVLMTCGGGRICRNGACVKGEKNTKICTDSDGGKNISEKGHTDGYNGMGDDSCFMSYDGINGSMSDNCSNINPNGLKCYVYEYYCENEIRSFQPLLCPNGCRGGACL